MSESPRVTEAPPRQHRAFLLHQLATAEDGELAQKDANKAPALKAVGLSKEEADRLREQLRTEGLLHTGKKDGSRSVIIRITDAGRDHLRELGGFTPPPTLPKREKKPRAPTVPKKSLAELVVELGDAPVPASKLGKPKKNAKPEVVEAFERALRELIAEGKLHAHPKGKYGKHPPPPKQEKKPRAPKVRKPPKVIEFTDLDLREAYILDIFARAKNRTISAADIERAFDGKLKKKEFESGYPDVIRFRGQGSFVLNPAAGRHALEQLVEHGYLDAAGTDDALAYTLTPAGAERLKDLREDFPVLPPVGKPAKATGAEMREQWEAFVLLHLLNAPDHTAAAGGVYAVSYPKGSKLNDATAWKLRGEVVAAGLVELDGSGDTAAYRLTDAGKTRLAGLSFSAFPDVTLTGTALTTLLAAARGGPKEQPHAPTHTHTHSPPPTPAPHATPSAADLEAAVMGIFRQVHTERFNSKQMVPIHAVRAEVLRLLGAEAASHAVFDDTLHRLRRKDRVRLIPIDDRSRAAEHELRDSITSAVGILFYVENIDGSPGA